VVIGDGQMTKLEELLNTYTADYAAWDAADADYVDAAWVAAWDAWIAYRAELIKTQENSND
tara:strand:- start:7105 stop:7287 length:183 start_codon:yes stop_codon:yes gene_type:complete